MKVEHGQTVLEWKFTYYLYTYFLVAELTLIVYIYICYYIIYVYLN